MQEAKRERNTAVVLAAGRGSRMGGDVHKQYLLIGGKPVLYYSLKRFEDFSGVDEVILVTGKEETDYCREQIVDKYGLKKVKKIVPGGRERYHSVYEGLQAAADCDYVFIHDGARPFLDEAMLNRALETVRQTKACVVGMPVKDTIKVADGAGYAVRTPDRSTLWTVQTPQVFSYTLIRNAYEKMLLQKLQGITDDAMVLEQVTGKMVKLVPGSYRNIKITTPEDLLVAEAFLRG